MSEEIKTPTPSEIEAAMVERELEASKSRESLLDGYASYFKMYSPLFNNGLQRFGKKALIRLIKLLTIFPVEEAHLKPLGKSEKDLFQIGEKLLLYKFSMAALFIEEEAMKLEKEKFLKGESDAGNEEKIS